MGSDHWGTIKSTLSWTPSARSALFSRVVVIIDFDFHTKYDVFQDSVGRAQKYVQSELERFQETLHRCVLSCQVYLLTTISKPQFKILGKIRYNLAGLVFTAARRC